MLIYESYLRNEPVIAASWNGLSAANQAFMTRAISTTQLPLTGGDVGFYQANQVDRIVAGIGVSSFAADPLTVAIELVLVIVYLITPLRRGARWNNEA